MPKKNAFFLGQANLDNLDDPVVRGLKETKVTYKRLGNSGLRVSVPILGAMSLGSKEWQRGFSVLVP